MNALKLLFTFCVVFAFCMLIYWLHGYEFVRGQDLGMSVVLSTILAIGAALLHAIEIFRRDL